MLLHQQQSSPRWCWSSLGSLWLNPNEMQPVVLMIWDETKAICIEWFKSLVTRSYHDSPYDLVDSFCYVNYCKRHMLLGFGELLSAIVQCPCIIWRDGTLGFQTSQVSTQVSYLCSWPYCSVSLSVSWWVTRVSGTHAPGPSVPCLGHVNFSPASDNTVSI